MDPDRLATAFVELADTLVEDFDLIDFLYRLVDHATDLLRVSAAGLMLADARGRLRLMACSDEETALLELFQLRKDQGPCLDCYRSGVPIDCGDLRAAGSRWDLFAPAAVRAGYAAAHALPMRLRAQTIGALSLFHTRPGALHPADTRIGQAMADVATIALIGMEVGRRRAIPLAQLQRALDARVVIEQATGALAEHLQVTPAQAFTALRAHARSHDQRLTELAYAVVVDEATAAAIRPPIRAMGTGDTAVRPPARAEEPRRKPL